MATCAVVEATGGIRVTGGKCSHPRNVGWTPRPSGPNSGYAIAPPIQSSLRDEPFVGQPQPWVETHGYHRMSLRDKNHVRGRSRMIGLRRGATARR